MKLYVEHHTLFKYDQPVREQAGETRLHPREDNGQRLLNFKLQLDPHAATSTLIDRFGNVVHTYSVLPWHVYLTVSALSLVDTTPNALTPAPPLSLLQRHDFMAASRYVPLTSGIADFARAHAQGTTDEAAARLLMTAIYQTCQYVPGSTDLSTDADAVLRGRRGVCQDFAHLLIGLCRSLAIPARYVSGYLYDPAKPADAILASHAWAEVYLDGQGWLSLDPTHNRATHDRYVRLAIGRDYADATPVRGTYKGKTKETLAVEVRIRPAELPVTAL